MRPYEHYIEAERLLEEIDVTKDSRDFVVAQAQVHATLALVQAQYSDSVIDLNDVEGYVWLPPHGKSFVIQPHEIEIVKKAKS